MYGALRWTLNEYSWGGETGRWWRYDGSADRTCLPLLPLERSPQKPMAHQTGNAHSPQHLTLFGTSIRRILTCYLIAPHRLYHTHDGCTMAAQFSLFFSAPNSPLRIRFSGRAFSDRLLPSGGQILCPFLDRPADRPQDYLGELGLSQPRLFSPTQVVGYIAISRSISRIDELAILHI